jgi:predicted O-methyltransferase YrrM
MDTLQQNTITLVLEELFKDSRKNRFKAMKPVFKSVFRFRPIKPSDFKEAYLSISKEQGEDLKNLIIEYDFKNIVEFGTSFGISTLYLAQGVLETEGRIVTTELIASKAQKAKENFEKAGVSNLIEVKIGDAIETLKNHNKPIDLLLLDGWKNLYLPLFQMLEANFHENTMVYVDNADMLETKKFLKTISQNPIYKIQSKYNGKVALIMINK